MSATTLANIDSEKVLIHILSFCDARSLCHLSVCNSRFHRIKSSTFEVAWLALCKKGWNIPGKRVPGSHSMKHGFKTLVRRLKMPKGSFSEKFRYVFGKVHYSGMSCWIMLGHTKDSQLKAVPKCNDVHVATHGVEVRLCIQNIHNDSVTIDLDSPSNTMLFPCPYGEDISKNISLDLANVSMNVQVPSQGGSDHTSVESSGSQPSLLDYSTLVATKIRVLAKNGNAVAPSDKQPYVCELRPLDSVVLSCDVTCPDSVEHEVDFLSMLDTVELHLRTKHSSYSRAAQAATDGIEGTSMNNENEVLLKVPIIPEAEIWNFYEEMSSGVILLRDKPLNEAW